MSNEAINWAFTQPIKHSTAKFVLVAMANHAGDGDWLAWPSVVSLTEATGQDRKTVLENLKRLTAMGYITDTGVRKGATKQVPVYRLNRDPKPVEQYQKRDDSENGTVPKFPDNSTVFPVEQSQNSVEAVPKTGHGTINEPPKEPSGNHQKSAKIQPVSLPSWMPSDAWQSWVDYRKSIKAPLTDKAASLCLAKLDTLRKAGHDPVSVIDQSIMSGKWTGLFPVRSDMQPTARASPRNDRHANTQRLLDRINGTNSHDYDPRIIDLNDAPA